ncbi:MAG: hypothetical protein SGBAC_005537 [Bacillariaceae sp.]
MKDTDLADVHLVGTDEEEIACNKAFLAAASPVFKRMFFRGFREQNEDRCKLKYHSKVLNTVVKYCYCGGDVDMSHILDGSLPLEEEAAFLVTLCDAARYFELDTMHSDLETKMGNLVFKQRKYKLAWPLLTFMLEQREDDGPLWCKLVQFVVENPKNCCFDSTQWQAAGSSTTTNHPNPDALAEILRRTKDTFAVVKCLQTWFTRENKKAQGGSIGTNQAIIKEVASGLDLRELSIQTLSKLPPNSLFADKIVEAVQHQHNLPWADVEEGAPKLYCVFGAAEKRVNGCYKPMSESRSSTNKAIYYKDEVYQSRTCLFLIHCKPKENKWHLSMTREKFDVIRRTGTVNPSLHLYVAQSEEEEETPQVPFQGWVSLEATSKSPVVAPIYKVEKSAAELEYESRRSNWA